jgi:hypothetical protein
MKKPKTEIKTKTNDTPWIPPPLHSEVIFDGDRCKVVGVGRKNQGICVQAEDDGRVIYLWPDDEKKQWTRVLPKKIEQIRTFENDHRNNAKLHNLHVRGVYEDLRIAFEAARALEERSRLPAGAMAFALREAMRAEIERSAASFEAAALLFAGLEPPKEDEEE